MTLPIPSTVVARLAPIIEETGEINVVIETPKGHRNKYAYDPVAGMFTLAGVLPAGAVFPYDFGFVPGTRGGDGDPIDVLVLMDEPAFVGCLVRARLIGVIEAEQTERDGQTTRNDRLVAVATRVHLYEGVRSLDDLGDRLVRQIEHFFASYNAIAGKRFTPLARSDPDRARQLVDHAIRRAEE